VQPFQHLKDTAAKHFQVILELIQYRMQVTYIWRELKSLAATK
jgi:hypothetical protein